MHLQNEESEDNGLDLQLWDRVMVGDDLCTIKFVGHIDEWPNTLSYGVEWDRVDRGKHSGDYKGCQLFSTHVPGSGSFLRESKLQKSIRLRQSITKALTNVYMTTDKKKNREGVTFGNKQAQSLGFDTLDLQNENILDLKSISLNKQSIYQLDIEDYITRHFHGRHFEVRKLDLGNNCFSNLTDIPKLVKYCPYLNELNLSGNRFHFDVVDCDIQPVLQVKKLFLVSCHITPEYINVIFKLFPNLEYLDLSLNYLSEDEFDHVDIPECLKELILSGNIIKEIPPKILYSNLESLDISDNHIESIPAKYSYSSNLKTLNISGNRINNWQTIDALNELFPSLDMAKFQRNSVLKTSQGEDDDSVYYQLITRMGSLHYLDGSFISPKVRQTAEAYFMSKLGKDGYFIDKNSKRWKFLETTYKNRTFQGRTPSSQSFLSNSLLRITIRRVPSNEMFELHVLDTWTIRNLKGRISSEVSVDVLRLKLFLSDELTLKDALDKDFLRIKDYYITSGSTIYYTVEN